MNRARIVAALLVSAALLAACPRKLEGPAPTLASAVPTTLCTEQLTTTVTLTGDGLSPLVSGGLTATPLLNLPQVSLVPEQTLTGDPATGSTFVVPDEPSAPEGSRVAWTSQQEMTAQILPELAVTPGLYTLHLANKNGKTVDLASAILAVPPPTLARAEADLLCKDQDNELVLSGDYFLQVGALQPTLTVGPKTFAPKSMDDCRALPGPQGVKACKKMTLALPSKSLESGTHVITVKNPETAACTSTASTVTLTLVACPTLAAIRPDLTCTAQGSQDLTVTGTGFLSVDGRTPTLSIGSEQLPGALADCTDVTGPGLREAVKSCTTLKATVPQGALTPTGASSTFDVHVINPTPANCTTQETVKFTTAPPPAVTSVVPDLVCTAAGTVNVVVNGTGFLTVQADATSSTALPSVKLGAVNLTPASAGGCTTVTGPLETVQSCTTLTVAVPQGLAAASYPVVVTNPAPAACSSGSSVTVAVAPPPVISSLTPDIATAVSQAVAVTLTGTSFIKVGSALPAVQLGAQTLAATTATSCTAIAGTSSGAEACTRLTFTVPQGTTPGEYQVSVLNPAPASCASGAVKLFLAPAPTLARLVPPGLCTGSGAGTIGVQGSDFYRIGGSAIPAVRIDTTSYVPTVDGASCTSIAGYSQTVERCTAMSILVAPTFANGTYNTVVVNPAPVQATSPTPLPFSVTVPPTLTGVSPSKVCSGGGMLTLTGTNFTSGMQVTLQSPTPKVASQVTVSGPTSATATFTGPLPVGGPYPVQVVTGAGSCNAALAAQVTVTNGPVVFFVDPPVVFNGIATQATVYASGFAASGLKVDIRVNGAAGTQTVTSQYNPTRANRILITLPNLPAPLAAGSYDVIVSDSTTTTCPGILLNAFRIVSQTSLALAGVSPPFAYTGSATAITVNASAGAIKSLPRLYLNPSGGGGVAIPLESVAVQPSGSTTAVVPSGQAAGTYDVIVVNPDGAVGLLTAAFKVLTSPLPYIDVVSPTLIVSNANAPITLTGGNFRAGATVSLLCQSFPGAAVTTGAVTATTAAATVTAGIPNGTACVVRLTNLDGSYADYSTIAVTNPSANPSGFKAGAALTQGRRGLVAAEGYVTRAAQFLYGIGGDDGAASPVSTDTVEVAPLDIYGTPSTFVAQRYKLTVPRSLATGQRVGRWLYVAGGRNGATVLSSIERAYLLDPKDAMQVTDADFTVDPINPGLPTGVYSYRVAPVMQASDAFNPGGENLPSDPFPISVPVLADGKITLTLHWSAVTGATAYRLYRTVSANDAAGTERLLVEVPASATTYSDNGSVTPAGLVPMKLGSTGAWAVVGNLPEAREGAGSAVAWDPLTATRPNQRYLYVVGGRTGSAAGTELATYVKVPLTINTDASQTVGTIAAGANVLATARWQLGVMTANGDTAAAAGAGQYVYAVGGLVGAATSSASQSTTVGANGDLGAWSTATGPNPARAGFAATLIANQALVFGGRSSGGPLATGSGATVTASPPTLNNWNSTSGQLSVARYLCAGTLHGPFVYVMGGTSGTGAELTTEQMTW